MNYPSGVTQDSFDRETERLNEEPKTVTPGKPGDPKAFDELRASLVKKLQRGRNHAADCECRACWGDAPYENYNDTIADVDAFNEKTGGGIW